MHTLRAPALPSSISYLSRGLSFNIFCCALCLFVYNHERRTSAKIMKTLDNQERATMSNEEILKFSLVWQLVTLFGFPYDNTFSKPLRNLWSLFPPNLFAAAISYLGEATSTKQDPGIQWKDRSVCSYRNDNCVLTMVITFIPGLCIMN